MGMSSSSVLLLGSLLFIGGVASVSAGERIAVDALPESVRAAVETRFPGAKLLKAERESALSYEVKIRHDGRRIEVKLNEDGVILDLSGRVSVEGLPTAVTAALNERFPGVKLLKAELDVEAGEETFEVELRDGKRRYNVEVTAAGRIVDVDRD